MSAAGSLCLVVGFISVSVCGCDSSGTSLTAVQRSAPRERVLVAWTSGRGDRDLGEALIRPVLIGFDMDCIGSGRLTLHLVPTSVAESLPCAHPGGEAGTDGTFQVTDRRTVRVVVTAAKTTRWIVRVDQVGPANTSVPVGPINAWIQRNTVARHHAR